MAAIDGRGDRVQRQATQHPARGSCLSFSCAQSTVGFANGLSLCTQSTAGFANGLSPMSSNLNPASLAEISSWTTAILLAKRGATLKGLYERFDLSLALDDPARAVYNRAGAARLARDDYNFALMRLQQQQQQHLQLQPAQDAAAAAAAAAATPVLVLVMHVAHTCMRVALHR